MAINFYSRGGSSTSDYQRLDIAKREDLISRVGAQVPKPKKPKVGFLQRLGIILDTAGGAIRAGIHAAQTPEKESVLGAIGAAIVDRTKRPSGADILDAAGVTNKYGKAIGGFALEMALDPLAWVSGGAGGLFFRGASIATKSGKVITLTKPATKILQQLISGGVPGELAQSRVLNMVTGSRANFLKYVDQGGLKFMGMQTPLTAAKLGKVAQAVGITRAQKWLSQTSLGKAATAASELLVPDKHLVNSLRLQGMPEGTIRRVMKLRRLGSGAKALTIANRTGFFKEQYKELVKYAPDLGITTGDKARRVAEALPYAREMDEIIAKYGKNWVNYGKQLYEADLQRSLIKGITGRAAIKSAKRAQERFEDGVRLAQAVSEGTLPKGLQDLITTINRTYDDIAERDIALGFVKGKIDDYMWRDTRRVAPAGTKFARGVSKYGASSPSGKERVFGNVLEIDLASNWEREYDFLKGVTIRGVSSDMNAINKEFVNNLAKMAGVPIRKMSRYDTAKYAKFNEALPKLLGIEPGALANAGISNADDIARMSASELHKLFGNELKWSRVQKVVASANKLFGDRKISTPPGWVDASTIRLPGHKGVFTDLMVPQAIAEDLTKASKPFLNVNEGRKLVEGLEWYMNQWKTGVTVWWPAFHVRNLLSNIFNASYLGGADIKVFGEAMKLQVAIGKGVGMGDLVKGTGMTLGEIDGIMTRYGLKGFGQTEQARTGSKALEEIIRPRNKVYAKVATVGKAIEENSKLGLLLDRLRKGDNIENAVLYVKKYLFDYGDLTDFEKGTLKHLMPFYTWIRKNLPLQMEQMLKTPGKATMLGRALDASSRMLGEDLSPEEQAMLPDFAMAGLGIDKLNFGKDKNGKFRTLLSLGMPIEDLDKLSKPGMEFLAALTPPLKYVLEEISGKDFFRSKPLEELNTISTTNGQLLERFGSDQLKELLNFQVKTNEYGKAYKMNPAVVHILAQLPISRAGSAVKKFEKLSSADAEVISTALSLIVGVNIYHSEMTDYFRNQERIEQLNKVIEELYPKIKSFTTLYIPKKK